MAQNLKNRGADKTDPSLPAILIIDDDPGDAQFTALILGRLGVKNPIHILAGGQDLVLYLRGEAAYSDRAVFPHPAMILLDLRMPNMDGFSTLEWLQRHAIHYDFPVAVLSGTEDLSQMSRAYQLGARTFFTKPINVVQFTSAVRAFGIPIEFTGGSQASGV